MSGLRAAAALLTRVPVGRGDVDPARAVPWFPVVGAVVGAALAGAYVGARAVLPATVAAGLAVGIGIALTGALHEDGLADTADGFGSGARGEEALRIMRDPRVGAFGAIAVALSIVLRVAAVAALDASTALAALPLAHISGRVGAVWVMRGVPPVPGLGASYAMVTTPGRARTATVLGLVLALAAAGAWAAAGLATAALVAVGIGRMARARIGGANGDVLGAVQQVTEIVVLVIAAAAVAGEWPAVAWWR